MKKYFVFLGIAALTLAACTKTEIDETAIPDQKIEFNVASYVPQTRAGEVSFLKEFEDPSEAQFKSNAFMKGVGVNDYQNFFPIAGEIIKWNAGKKEWAPSSHDYYWPKSAESYVNFFSWYDTGVGPTTKENGKLEWKDREIGTGDNIMYADPAWRFQKNTKAPEYGKDGVTEGIPTLFHHALAQVEFRAVADKIEVENVCTWTIKLDKLDLKVANKGTLTLSATEPTSGFNIHGSWGEGETAPKWVADATKSSIMPASFNVTKTDVNDAAAKLLKMQSVLPQSLTGVNLTFNLDITTTYSNGVTHHEIIPVTIPMTGVDGFGPDAWALNTKYTYTLTIVPGVNRVLFDPAVESDWQTVDAGSKTL